MQFSFRDVVVGVIDQVYGGSRKKMAASIPGRNGTHLSETTISVWMSGGRASSPVLAILHKQYRDYLGFDFVFIDAWAQHKMAIARKNKGQAHKHRNARQGIFRTVPDNDCKVVA